MMLLLLKWFIAAMTSSDYRFSRSNGLQKSVSEDSNSRETCLQRGLKTAIANDLPQPWISASLVSC